MFLTGFFFRIDAFNWKNEWTNQTIQEEDAGAGRNHQYTSRYYRGNEWYSKWLPDQTRNDQGRGLFEDNSRKSSLFVSSRKTRAYRSIITGRTDV